MTLSMIVISFVATIAGVVLHVVLWRIRRPADDALALAATVGAVPLVVSLAFTFAMSPTGSQLAFSTNFVVVLAALSILHVLFALVYMGCYAAVQAASPTVLIILFAVDSREGVTQLELEARLTDDLVCGDLVQAAIDEKFVDLRDGGLYLGGRGRSLLKLGRLVRKLVGLAPSVG